MHLAFSDLTQFVVCYRGYFSYKQLSNADLESVRISILFWEHSNSRKNCS